jgi:hypothetical protein
MLSRSSLVPHTPPWLAGFIVHNVFSWMTRSLTIGGNFVLSVSKNS